MPATVPSHQGVVLPLKLWRPQWFDGVALAVGAASPDVAKAFLQEFKTPFAHEAIRKVGLEPLSR